jgi:hypothetical protein
MGDAAHPDGQHSSLESMSMSWAYISLRINPDSLSTRRVGPAAMMSKTSITRSGGCQLVLTTFVKDQTQKTGNQKDLTDRIKRVFSISDGLRSLRKKELIILPNAPPPNPPWRNPTLNPSNLSQIHTAKMARRAPSGSRFIPYETPSNPEEVS